MELKDVNQKLQAVGFLKSEKICCFLIRRKENRSWSDTMGYFTAVVSPEGRVTVYEMNIFPDMADTIKSLFAGTDVEVEEMPWC